MWVPSSAGPFWLGVHELEHAFSSAFVYLKGLAVHSSPETRKYTSHLCKTSVPVLTKRPQELNNLPWRAVAKETHEDTQEALERREHVPLRSRTELASQSPRRRSLEQREFPWSAVAKVEARARSSQPVADKYGK
ncbi:hypothetical protein NDU88_003512 [Pleurodeles waltl]|uniref:Uncharacterized protein n=1 Tax=Pleurodeles waltl TaxID=8319 RepID=A0AAV7UEI8_PLEWA|nr:hypothetical protein NDU88_003512 [Pleurodeles waltl]